MNPSLLNRIVQELGLTKSVFDRLEQIPYEQARAELEALKVAARKAYKRLAFEYHPDRNGGRDELFKALGAALHFIEGRQVRPPRPVTWHVQIDEPYTVTLRRRAPSYSTSTEAPKSSYDARRAVFLRAV